MKMKPCHPAAVELLTFSVPPQLAEKFVELDDSIWTETLARYDDGLQKEVWLDGENRGRVTTVIYWSSLERWKSVPAEVLAATQKRFDEAFAADYRLIAEGHKECQMYRRYQWGEDK